MSEQHHFTEAVGGTIRDAFRGEAIVSKLDAADGGHWFTTEQNLTAARDAAGGRSTCGIAACVNPEHGLSR